MLDRKVILENLFLIIKEVIQWPSFWFVVFIFISILTYMRSRKCLFRVFFLVAFFWLVSMTPLGSSLWFSSLKFAGGFQKENCVVGVDTAIVLPGGMDWRRSEGIYKLSKWSILRAERVVQLNDEKPLFSVIIPGGPIKDEFSEASLMFKYINRTIDQDRFIIGNDSKTTYENINSIVPLLKKENTYYLVTSDWHMPRARRVAEKLAINVCPVLAVEKLRWGLVPSYESHWKSKAAIHEWLGLIWYKINGIT